LYSEVAMPFAEVNGTTLHYRLDGPAQGPVLMLVNSLASALEMWDPQIETLSAAGYRLLRYDARGHGRSAVPVGPYSIEQLTDDALGLLDALGIGRLSLCGCSLGGMIAQEFGARHGGRLDALVLFATTAHMPAKDVWSERIASVRERGMSAVAESTLERWFTAAGHERLRDPIERIRRGILETPVEGYCSSAVGIRDMDLRETIRAIAVPTLVLVGEQDPGTPVSASEFLHQRIRGSVLQVLPDAAHLANIERPEAFNEALLGFLGSRASVG
jgi:3-oxoadipate enol-lactonase